MSRDYCLQISHLRAIAPTKPEGYLAALLAAGEVDRDNLWFDYATIDALRARFSPGRPPVLQECEILERFFQLDTPCPFPECESLRADYSQAAKALAEGCSSCEQQAVRNKFADRVRQRLNPGSK